jgi:uncharacterized membrane protein
MISGFANHLKKGFLSGILVVLPLFITAVVLKLLLGMVTGFLSPTLSRVFPHIPIWVKTVVSLSMVLLIIYLLGMTTKHFLGRWFLSRTEQMLFRIPLLSSVYGASREVVRICLNPERESTFKEVVLVEFPGPGLQSFGFITGSMIDAQGRPCYKIFIPTTPNPTTGFLQVVEKSRVTHCGMTVEEGIKMIMSAGLLGPESLKEAAAANPLNRKAAS